MVRELFKKKDAIPYIPASELSSVYSNLKQVFAVVQGIESKLGMKAEEIRASTYRADQSAIMIKLVLMSLSKEVTGLMEHLNVEDTGDRIVLEDCTVLEECSRLVGRLTSAVEDACRLIPCSALHTLSDMKHTLG
jgi:hypothetical protein